MNKLLQIFEHKAEEVRVAKVAVPLAEIKSRAADAAPVRPFRVALAESPHPLALIAEVKKASPSKGLIRADFDAADVARAYREAGADCLSVLTDERYFQGRSENLVRARETSGLPCLRKDFILDPYQVFEARAWGADCVLLIVAGPMETTLLRDLYLQARGLGMDVLVEVHSAEELEVAHELGADLIGVNNRNLADMSTSLAISEELLPRISPNAIAVSESALESPGDLGRVRAAGARAVLIGTTFCASPDIRAKVQEVMGW